MTEALKERWLHLSLLTAAIFLAYGKILGAGFINWDDLDYVFNIPDISAGISGESLQRFFTRNYLGNYQPLPVLSYAFDHQIGGTDPFVYHLHSLIWHLAAAVLVYHFTGMLHPNRWVAFFVALLFALHPVQTESVSWISARNKSMNAAFYFAAVVFYIRYVRTGSGKNLFLVLFCGLLAYLCKATALSLPLALFAVDIWLRRPLNSKKIWLEKLPLVLAGIPVALITLHAQKEVEFLQHHSGFGWSNIVFAGYAYVLYIVHLAYPFGLSVLYPYPPEVTFVHVLLLLVALIIGVLMVVAYRRGKTEWAGGILFFTVNLLPVLQLVQFGETLMADRYLYIACIGLWYPFVVVLLRVGKGNSMTGKAIVTVLALLFLGLTFVRNDIWENEIAFWRSVLDKFPESAVAHYSIGGAYMKLEDLKNAMHHMEMAVKYDPGNYKAWRNRGSVQMRLGKMNDALGSFNRSISLHPYAKAYFSRAMLHYQMRNFRPAIADLDKVLQQEPRNARAYYLRAESREQLSELNAAYNDYNMAITFDGSQPLFFIRRGLLQARQQNMRAALDDLNKAVALKPDDGAALYYRGVIRYNLRQSPCDDLHKAYMYGYRQAGEMLQKVCGR